MLLFSPMLLFVFVNVIMINWLLWSNNMKMSPLLVSTTVYRSGFQPVSRPQRQGRIQPVSIGGTISVLVGSQVLLRVHYIRQMKYSSQHCCDKTMDGKCPYIVNTVSQIVQNHGEWSHFSQFRGGDRPNCYPMDQPMSRRVVNLVWRGCEQIFYVANTAVLY